MIHTENISYKIDEKYLVQNISVNFSSKKITLISGPNGAGKTTLIHLLSGRYKPSEGKVWLENSSLDDISQKDRAKVCAVLSQSVELAFPLSVRNVVAMGRYPHCAGHLSRSDLDICMEAIHFFDIAAFADRNYLSLSGGEKQRVQFARVAAQIWPDKNSSEETKYLLLDEPFTHLDIHYQLQFINHLREMMQQQPMTIIGVIHDLNLAVRHSDRAVLMSEGKVVATGNSTSVYTQENIGSVFSVKPQEVADENGSKGFLF